MVLSVTTGVVKNFMQKVVDQDQWYISSLCRTLRLNSIFVSFLERENSISNRDIKCRKSRVIGMPNTSTMFCLARGRRRLWGMMRSLWNSDGNFYTTPIILKLLCVCVHLIWFFASFEKKHPRLLVKRNVWQHFEKINAIASTEAIYFWIWLVCGF